MFNIINVDGADLTVYLKGSNSFTITLSTMELVVMLKAVGFEIESGNAYNTFADNTLEQILKGEINPFRLKKVE